MIKTDESTISNNKPSPFKKFLQIKSPKDIEDNDDCYFSMTSALDSNELSANKSPLYQQKFHLMPSLNKNES